MRRFFLQGLLFVIISFNGFAQNKDTMLLKIEKKLQLAEWISCGNFDSIDQYRAIMFVNKNLLKGNRNCTGEHCSSFSWTFSTKEGKKILETAATIGGCPGQSLMAVSYNEFEWRLDPNTHCLVITKEGSAKTYEFNIDRLKEESLLLKFVWW